MASKKASKPQHDNLENKVDSNYDTNISGANDLLVHLKHKMVCIRKEILNVYQLVQKEKKQGRKEPIEEIKETIENSDSLLSELEDIYIQKKSSLRESQEKLHDLQSIRRANYSKIDYARNNIRVIDDQLTQQMEQIEDLTQENQTQLEHRLTLAKNQEKQKLSIESSQKRKFQKLQDANQKLKRQIIEQNQKVNEILNATEAIVSENSQLLEEYRKIHQEYDHCSKNLFRLEAMHHNSKRINEDLQTSVKQLTKNREHSTKGVEDMTDKLKDLSAIESDWKNKLEQLENEPDQCTTSKASHSATKRRLFKGANDATSTLSKHSTGTQTGVNERPRRQRQRQSIVTILPQKRESDSLQPERNRKKSRSSLTIQQGCNEKISSSVFSQSTGTICPQDKTEPELSTTTSREQSNSLAREASATSITGSHAKTAREQNPCNMKHATPTTVPHHIDPLFFDI